MELSFKEMNDRLIDLDQAPNVRIWRVEYDELSAPEKVLLAIRNLEDEVNNGGFWQYFYNTSGCSAPDLVEALRAISAHNTAQIAERAISVVGDGIPWPDLDARRAAIDSLPQETSDALTPLDEAFFEYPDDLTTGLYHYVAAHRIEIGAPDDF